MLTRISWIILINLVLYYRTLFYGYVGDDIERSQRTDIKPRNKWHKQWLQFISERHYNSMHSHLYSILTHTITCVLIYLVFGSNDTSFWAAILFSINPVNMFNSVWLTGRLYTVSAILVLLIWWLPVLTPTLYYVGSYTAINLMFFPLVFINTEWWWLIAFIPVIHLLNRRYLKNIKDKMYPKTIKTTNSEMRSIHPRKFIMFCKNYFYYFLLCIIPLRIGCDHEFLFGFGTNKTDNKKGYKLDWWFWGGLGLGLAIIGAVIAYKGLFSLGLLWFSVNIAMWCNYITIQQQIAQRYAYIANIGLMLALSFLIHNNPIILTIFIVFYLTRTWYFMPAFQNDYWMVEYTIHEFPKLHYMWLTRAVKKHSAQDYKGAFYDLGEAYQHKPYDFKVCFDLMVSLLLTGDINGARDFCNKTKQTIYDEGNTDAIPKIAQMEALINQCAELAKSGTAFQVDLQKIIVVK